MDNVPSWVNYVARDLDGRLRGHMHKPSKDQWVGKWISVNEHGKVNDTYTFTECADGGILKWTDTHPCNLVHANKDEHSDYVISQRKEAWSVDLTSANEKTVHAIMEVLSEDGQLKIKQIFSLETECEAEVVLDYINELEPERKFYIREEAGA